MRTERLIGNPSSVRISKVIEENSKVRTILFEQGAISTHSKPGQFLMVWVPGIDEIPMSVTFMDYPTVGITVVPVGEATEILASLKEGQWLGVRGPFGNGFDIGGRALVVGGGSGLAALRPVIRQLTFSRPGHIEYQHTLIMAAKTESELFFYEEFKYLGINIEIATDDGSAGFKGLATELAEQLVNKYDFSIIYTCGPELMMKGLFELAKRKEMQIQASLERFMKCGCGICGTCAMDPTGDLVCVEGPVFTGEKLAELTEFGSYHRDATGFKVDY